MYLGIRKVVNGYILETFKEDSDGDLVLEGMSEEVFEEPEDKEWPEGDAFIRLLYAINDYVGPSEDPWAKDGQIQITLGPGHEYEPSLDEKQAAVFAEPNNTESQS